MKLTTAVINLNTVIAIKARVGSQKFQTAMKCVVPEHKIKRPNIRNIPVKGKSLRLRHIKTITTGITEKQSAVIRSEGLRMYIVICLKVGSTGIRGSNLQIRQHEFVKAF